MIKYLLNLSHVRDKVNHRGILGPYLHYLTREKCSKIALFYVKVSNNMNIFFALK